MSSIPADRTHSDDVGHLLWEVSAWVALLGEAELAQTRLTLPSSGMLAQIASEPGVTIAEISRRVPKSQQAISQLVGRLERLGYVERRLGSGRGVGLHPTESGLEALAEGLAAEQAFERRVRELLGEKRHDQLRRLLMEARELVQDSRLQPS